MFVLVAAGGLTMAASMAPIAKDFKIEKEPVELFGLIMPALVSLCPSTASSTVSAVPSSVASDQIGREYTMALAFVLGAAPSISSVSRAPTGDLCSGDRTVLGVWTAIFSLFPATQGDTFGAKYAASNAGMLYTAKGSGALLVPWLQPSQNQRLEFSIHDRNGLQLLAAVLALLVLSHCEPVTSPSASDFRAHGWTGRIDAQRRRTYGNRKSSADAASFRMRKRSSTAEDTLQRKAVTRSRWAVTWWRRRSERRRRHDLHTLRRHIIDIYDGCVDEGIRIIDVRHEQVAAHAADGYARQTGKLGCVVTTAGPGCTNR